MVTSLDEDKSIYRNPRKDPSLTPEDNRLTVPLLRGLKIPAPARKRPTSRQLASVTDTMSYTGLFCNHDGERKFIAISTRIVVKGTMESDLPGILRVAAALLSGTSRARARANVETKSENFMVDCSGGDCKMQAG